MGEIVGGGPKKILYTLNTVRKIGLKNSAKALGAKNTCKACGLGMGGQRGGMTNELGEFPAVCNKSVQAQSTDIQPPIPSQLFEHSIAELRSLSAFELEHAGRLGAPMYKAAGEAHYREVEWDWALDYAARRFKASQAARSIFYASGRSSNEAGFLLQLLARLYGTNNVTNCSYYCHQATSVGLGSTIGSSTATIELDDLTHCDLVFVIGANPASNHPRLIHQLKNCRDRGGQVIVINPAKEPGLVKFAVPKSAASMIAGGTDIASLYVQPHIGGDLALFKGIAKAVLARSAENKSFIEKYTDHYAQFKDDINNTPWAEIELASGVRRIVIENIAALYSKAQHAIFAWGMGMTHHQFGSQNVEYIANLALLRGMMGKRYAGLLPLRGHSNVQGIGSIGVKPVLAEEVFNKLEQQLQVKLPTRRGFNTLEGLEAAHDGNIDNALIVGGNLYSATPQADWAAKALDSIGFKLFLTTTLNQGHVHGVDSGDVLVLPVAARDEEPQSTTQESMFNFVRLSDGGIERLDNVRSEVHILAELGQRLLGNSPLDFSAFGDHEKIRETIAKTIPGMEALEDIGVAKKEFHVRGRILHHPEFKTPNQRAQFQVHPLPNPRQEHYPFLLATIRSEGQFNSIIYQQTDSYRFGAGRDAVLMGQQDMTALGIKNGDRVSLQSPTGTMNNLKVQRFDLPAGNILAYYPEANVLSERKVDPRSKTPNFKSIPVKVVQA